MAIITAYRCDKTKRLFAEKGAYIEHLKTRARMELRTNNEHPRFRILQRKFEALRQNARSFEEVAQWLEANVRTLDHLSIRFQKRSAKAPVTPTIVEKVYFFPVDYVPYCATVKGFPIHGVPLEAEKPGKEKAYPGARGDFCYTATNGVLIHRILKALASCHFGGDSGQNDYHCCSFTMFGEDWPFVGAQCLFDERHSGRIREGEKRILQYAFPGMDVDKYTQLHGAGLLPDTVDEFKDFMFKYRRAECANSLLSAEKVVLPPDLSHV